MTTFPDHGTTRVPPQPVPCEHDQARNVDSVVATSQSSAPGNTAASTASAAADAQGPATVLAGPADGPVGVAIATDEALIFEIGSLLQANNPTAALLRLQEYIEPLRADSACLARVREMGEVYVYPSDWRCAKQGGPPPIDAFEKVDLSDF